MPNELFVMFPTSIRTFKRSFSVKLVLRSKRLEYTKFNAFVGKPGPLLMPLLALGSSILRFPEPTASAQAAVQRVPLSNQPISTFSFVVVEKFVASSSPTRASIPSTRPFNTDNSVPNTRISARISSVI